MSKKFERKSHCLKGYLQRINFFQSNLKNRNVIDSLDFFFFQNGTSLPKFDTSPYKIPLNLQIPNSRPAETSFDARSPIPRSPNLKSPASAAPKPSPRVEQMLEKTTEGILKAARLGDIRMLSELHREGYSLLSIDETGKTALHYGAR